jgi:lipopolysaccharide transport system ATP-binding protein
MPQPIISVEDLSKRYFVGHQSAQRESYTTLRDVIARDARNFARKAADVLHGRQIVQGDEIEEFWALRHISIELHEGEILGIIGSNGAGKSTLLKILSRITEPSQGRVRIRGRVASLLEVGTGFHPELSGRDNIYLNGAILGMKRAEIKHKFDEIVEFAGVAKFLDTPVKHYSSGMYVRLAFAVGAHLDPDILIVDEVLAVGDAEFQRKCLGKMGTIAKEGRTVVLVSHNMNSVERICGRLCHLAGGRIAGMYSNVREGIINYLQSSRSTLQRIWVGDGKEFNNDYFQPRRLEVRTMAPISTTEGPFSNKYAVRVSVSGFLKQIESGLNIGIAVYNDEEELMLWTFTTDTARESWPRLKPGPVELQTTMPERFLNEGKYRVELLASIHNQSWLIQPGRAPSVEYAIQGGLSDSPLWYGKRPGLLGVVLPWQLAENAP